MNGLMAVAVVFKIFFFLQITYVRTSHFQKGVLLLVKCQQTVNCMAHWSRNVKRKKKNQKQKKTETLLKTPDFFLHLSI